MQVSILKVKQIFVSMSGNIRKYYKVTSESVCGTHTHTLQLIQHITVYISHSFSHKLHCTTDVSLYGISADTFSVRLLYKATLFVLSTLSLSPTTTLAPLLHYKLPYNSDTTLLLQNKSP